MEFDLLLEADNWKTGELNSPKHFEDLGTNERCVASARV